MSIPFLPIPMAGLYPASAGDEDLFLSVILLLWAFGLIGYLIERRKMTKSTTKILYMWLDESWVSYPVCCLYGTKEEAKIAGWDNPIRARVTIRPLKAES